METILEFGDISFNRIERYIFQEMLRHGADLLRRVLEGLDAQLAQERPRGRYALKEKRVRHLDSLLGTVEFSRRYYRDRGTGEQVFLLDEYLGLEKSRRLSPALGHTAVVQGVLGPSYRSASESLRHLYGYSVLSPETVRQLVLETGEEIFRDSSSRQLDPRGEESPEVLYLEADGYWHSLQGELRSRCEVKLLLSHEGWRPRYPGSSEHELVGRCYRQGIRSSEEFWEAASRELYSRYDLQDTVVVINGDRADWIREGVDYFPRALYQMDRYHIVKDLHRLLGASPTHLSEALSAYRRGEVVKLQWVLADALDHLPEGDNREKLRGLLLDIGNNPESCIDYRRRLEGLGIDTEGMRGLGAAESTVDRFSNRTRKRGQSWSLRGLMGIIRSIGKYFEGDIEQYTLRSPRIRGMNLSEEMAKRTARVKQKTLKALWDIKQATPIPMNMGTNRTGGMARLLRTISHPKYSAT